MSLADTLRAYTGRMRSRMPSRQVSTWMGDPLTLQVLEAPTRVDKVEEWSAARLWETQPHLRTVVDYIATNIAQLGIHVFRRDESGDRARIRTGVAAQLLARPNPGQVLSEFLSALVTQMALYADAFVWVYQSPTGPAMQVVPNEWVSVEQDAFGAPISYEIMRPDAERPITCGPEEILRFPGWSPSDPGSPSSPIDTLRMILAEQQSATTFRAQVWRKGGRFQGYISRPKDAPEWDDKARVRFMRMLQDHLGNEGPRAGENPLFEDGMTFNPVGFSAKDEQWAEATKIALETVCQVYHVPPVMVGITDDANYSNVTAYQRQLYTSTLASWLTRIEQRFNAFLLPMIGAPSTHFVEFNVEAKLRGDFAEQYRILQTAVGAPILTRNEARRMLNYPSLEDGDGLVTPLNVLVGGQASPTDVDTSGDRDGLAEGAGEKTADVIIAETYRRAARCIAPRKAAGRPDWWTPDRWETELAHDLAKAGIPDAHARAEEAVKRLGEEVGAPKRRKDKG